jgi:hypothetical protein
MKNYVSNVRDTVKALEQRDKENEQDKGPRPESASHIAHFQQLRERGGI